MKKYIVIPVLMLVLLIVGCRLIDDDPDLDKPAATILGYVSYTRGGPAIPNAKVYGIGFEAFTDEEGFFTVEVPAEETFDMLVEKESYGDMLIHDIYLAKGEELKLEISCHKVFNPDWSTVPPRLIVEGVSRGETVSGVLDIKIELTGERDSFVFYVYFGGQQRFPVEAVVLESNEEEVSIDTTCFPNGEGYIRLLAYDDNNNAAMTIIPVSVENETIDRHVPGHMTYLNINSITWGDTYGWYSQDSSDRPLYACGSPGRGFVDLTSLTSPVRPNSFTGDGTIQLIIEWEEVPDASGYNIYRSFDGEIYELYASIAAPNTYVEDHSPEHSVNKMVYYKVVPYNSKGEGVGLMRFVAPLPVFNTILLEPANGAANVPLKPTFKWDTSVPFESDVEISYLLYLHEGTDYLIYDEGTQRKSITLPFPLEPGYVYIWELRNAIARKQFTKELDGFAGAQSVAGLGTGSLNGEFIFTTTLESN